ncbi:MAG TPA: helix-turn-helix domain-containing protein [Ornithinibacter sp.]|nr:helix-turn-helix domain-containing protein [Ornithinibacter sp.]
MTSNTAGTRRPYRSPAREASAAMTRRRIVDAARRLFVDAGYVATSVRSIARAAGVAEKTVYLQFETKPAILKAVVDSAIVGSEPDVPASRSRWFLEVLAQPRLDRKVELLADGTSALHERTGPVFAVAREAASVDPAVAALWSRGKRRHLSDMTTMANSFAEHGLIPAPLSIGWATELLYVLLGPENWYLIRHELGHDERHYRDWIRMTLDQALSQAGPPLR